VTATTLAVPWRWPVDVGVYDRCPSLSDPERDMLARVAFRRKGGQWPVGAVTTLERLLRPIHDAEEAIHVADVITTRAVMRHLLRHMTQRDTALWAWSNAEWEDTIRDDTLNRLLVGAVGYLLCDLPGVAALRHVTMPQYLARRLFGDAAVAAAVGRARAVAGAWGYETTIIAGKPLAAAVGAALVIGRSPRLEDMTPTILTALHEAFPTRHRRNAAILLSRVLVDLRIIARPLADDAPSATRRDVDERVPPEWRAWCRRWVEHSTMPTRMHAHGYLLKTGRWLACTHPEVTTPAAWTYALAVEYVAAVDRMTVGAYGGDNARVRTILRQAGGEAPPLRPQSKVMQLGALRLFFRDLQEWGWIPVRFDPTRGLRTPRAIKALIGPDPRVIDGEMWAKLLWAGLNLTAADLSAQSLARYPLEFVRAVAAVWLFAGLRSDEVSRLRVGCVRWQRTDVTVPETGELLPREAMCFLDVPVQKTGTAFTKPVHPLVGHRIEEWERVRPMGQPAALDAKTGALVHFLFSQRQRRMAKAYINASLIPLLCRKGGIPEHDARGRITSHRARATIASQLYNAKEPMSLVELQAWLGHRDPATTQHYAKVDPTKLAKAYVDTGYFDRNMRTVEVLLDLEALTHGEEGLFYDLGHGLCANPYWDQCPHRLACVKCSFYRPSDRARLIQVRRGIRRMREEIPLTDDEARAADGDEEALTRLIDRHQDTPPPLSQRPDPRYDGHAAACVASMSRGEEEMEWIRP